MNFLAILLGGLAVKNVTDYPSEIRDLRKQIPPDERDAVMSQYKQLPNKSKADFKEALRNADLAAASQVLGKDLSKYNVVLNKKATEVAGDAPLAQTENDFSNRVKQILAVPTPDIDPVLVAEAAKRYEAAVPSNSNMSISDKTKRLLELST
jgi:hypothetical protein